MIIDQDTNLNSTSITPETPQAPTIPSRVPFVPTVRKDLFRRLEIIENDTDLGTGFRSGSQKRSGLKLAIWTWLSATIDALVLVSISSFFTLAFSFLMKTSPSSVVALFIKSQHPMLNLSLLFLLSAWSYLIFMRAFIGASIGEWTCDLRLGEPVQRFKVTYVLKVMFRTTLILATGVFILPLLSLIFRRDLAGDLSGVKIYSLQ